jgi:plasmid stabilization system protein ParE
MVIQWHWLADEQLNEIHDYALSEWGETKAKKTVANFRTAISRLSDWPYSAPIELLLEGESEEYRSMVIKRLHKVIYFVDEEKDSVVIFDIWDCRQDPETLRQRVIAQKDIYDDEMI